MTACPRSEVIRDGEVGVYHIWARCVRRAFLCGTDPLTGNDYNYRRDWVLGFEQRLAGLFGIEIGFHAELSNHIHLILRSRPDVVETTVTLEEYLKLLDWTGRAIRSGKRGAIPKQLAPILDRLGINSNLWTDLVTEFDTLFSHVVGTAAQVASRAKQVGKQWYHGRAHCAEAFG